MSQVNEKYIGESMLSEQPKKKVGLVIKDKAITMPKLSDELQEKIRRIDDLLPEELYLDEGQWENGRPYRHHVWDEDRQRYVTSEVWDWGCKWRCMTTQPRVVYDQPVYDEPWWRSEHWMYLEGDNLYKIAFGSSNGYKFYKGLVDTTVTPHLYCGNMDISEDVSAYYWNWTRCEERNWHNGNPEYTADDLIWNAQHQKMKTLHIGNNDMPDSWDFDNSIIFYLKVEVNDGRSVEYVENKIEASI